MMCPSTVITSGTMLVKVLTVAALSAFVTAGNCAESSRGAGSNGYFLRVGSLVPHPEDLKGLLYREGGKQKINFSIRRMKLSEDESPAPSEAKEHPRNSKHRLSWLPLFLGVGLFFCLTYFMGKKANNLAKEKEILKALRNSPVRGVPVKAAEEKDVKPDPGHSELVFFVDKHEAFKLDDLLEAAADLRSQLPCFSLYNVVLKSGAIYTVKRLKKLKVSFEDFSQTMRKVGNMKHPNILLLVGYNSTPDSKLLIYRYQSNGSLFDLLSDHMKGGRAFPWNLRLYIAWGIARGLDFIHRSSGNTSNVIIPHGNLKPSNVLLGDNMEALISDYGISKFIDPDGMCLHSSTGYTPPEKRFSQQGDVYSFGVMFLELLTGRVVENTGLDLPKWVKSMVQEEWTGEVFDREVAAEAKQWAFPLLNISLKCVADSPQLRPSMGEVLDKIEEAMDGQMQQQQQVQDSPLVCTQNAGKDGHPDCCVLHSVIPETWESPGSNH